jgi:hypothetical protein
LELIPANRDSNTKKYKEMKTLFNDGSTVPTAFVTKGRQRVKQYDGNTVFLNNGEEFEIELFNPTTNKVLAKIELNGVSLGSGIVLRPGERVFLERYLNEARKFLFETYEVDGSDPNVQKAIADNGEVDVKFYSETLNYYWNNAWTYTASWPPAGSPTITYGSGSYNSGLSGQGVTTGSISAKLSNSADSVNCFYSQSVTAPIAAPSKTVETGRVEKGSNSNQSFTYDNTSFNSWWSWSSVWKILPASRRPLEYRDLKVFCTSCGAKQKRHTHKFCPICGTKY